MELPAGCVGVQVVGNFGPRNVRSGVAARAFGVDIIFGDDASKIWISHETGVQVMVAPGRSSGTQ